MDVSESEEKKRKLEDREGSTKRIACPACHQNMAEFVQEECPHCRNVFCSRPNCFAAHQANYIPDSAGHNCCAVSKRLCGHCGGQFCYFHTDFTHASTKAVVNGHECCPDSVGECPHCRKYYCRGHILGVTHLESVTDVNAHPCCPDSIVQCDLCMGFCCSAHSLPYHKFIAGGCSHPTCPNIAGACAKCGKVFCEKCKTVGLKECKVSGGYLYCDLCKGCEKCEAPKEPLFPGFKLPTLLTRHDSQTLVKPSLQSLTILHIDVDQGACTLVLYTTPDGKPWTAVIDGGHGNPGRGQIYRYLHALGYKKIDALFLSHHDADHADGLSDLIESHGKFFTDGDTKLYVPYENSTHSIKNFLEYRKITRIRPTDTIKNEDGFVIKPYYGITQKDENGRSLALHIKMGKFSYLTCGDLPTNQGEDNVARSVGAVDVLFCSHHGSAHSTSSGMLAALKYPPISVISAGRNGYGHPNAETIQRYVDCLGNRPDLKLYLTGCQYNRKYVNPKYYEREHENHSVSIREIFKQFTFAPNPETLKNIITALNDGLLFCEEEGLLDDDKIIPKLKNELENILINWLEKDNTAGLSSLKLDKECDLVTKLVERCYKEMGWKQGTTPIIGVVSGTSEKMGPVGIRVLPPPYDNYVDVGFCPEIGYCPSDKISWKWRHRWLRGKEDKLIYFGEIFETGGEIDDATPKLEGGDESPKTYSTWFNIRINQRNAFSLSNRTNRQPDIKVKYRCRLGGCLENKRSINSSDRKQSRMVLVSCEYCVQKGCPVAFHESCFLSLVLPNGKFDEWVDEKLKNSPTPYISENYEKLKWNGKERKYSEVPHHPLWERLLNLIDQRESPEIPVVVPAEFEACYFCVTFRPTRSLGSLWTRGIVVEKLAETIKNRRNAFEKDLLEVSIGFDSNATFKDFYKKQCEINEFQQTLK